MIWLSLVMGVLLLGALLAFTFALGACYGIVLVDKARRGHVDNPLTTEADAFVTVYSAVGALPAEAANRVLGAAYGKFVLGKLGATVYVTSAGQGAPTRES